MRALLDLRLLLFGLLVYVAFLVWSFPAQRAYAYWQHSDLAEPNLRLSGIDGSIWSGRAALALLNGQRLEALEWHFQPWALLTGKVGIDWRLSLPEAQGAAGYAQGSTRLGLDGGLQFPAVEGRLPALLLATLGGAEAVRPSGSVSLNLQDLRWDGQRLRSANGRIVWSGAGVNLFKPVTLGDLSLTLQTVDADIKGVLSDASGPLEAAGELTLSADGRYTFNGSFAPRQGVAGAGELASALNSLGRPGPDGKWRIQQAGQLTDLGLRATPAR